MGELIESLFDFPQHKIKHNTSNEGATENAEGAAPQYPDVGQRVNRQRDNRKSCEDSTYDVSSFHGMI